MNLDSIKSQISITAVLERLGHQVKNKRALCPFHEDHSPSLQVYESTSSVYCFSCQRGGDIFDLLDTVKHFALPEAIDWLADAYGTPRYKTLERKTQEQIQYEVTEKQTLEGFNSLLQRRLWRDEPEANATRQYMNERGFDNDDLRRFQLGYYSTCKEIAELANKADLPLGILRKHGLIPLPANDHSSVWVWQGRITGAWRARNGQILTWWGRSLTGQEPKYFFLADHKKTSPFGLQYVENTEQLLIVEGMIDCLALHREGIKCAVATGGGHLTDEQIQTLKALKSKRLILNFDLDEVKNGRRAGHENTISAIKRLASATDQRVYVIEPCEMRDGDNPEKKQDPDTTVRRLGAPQYVRMIDRAQAAPIWLARAVLASGQFNSAIEKEMLLDDLAKNAAIQDPLYRDEIAKMIGQAISMGTREVKRAIKERTPKDTFKRNDTLPTVIVSNRDMAELSDEFMAALMAANKPEKLFLHAGALSRIIKDESGLASIDFYDAESLRGEISRIICCLRQSEDKLAPAYPPIEIAKNLVKQKSYQNLPPLKLITRTPIIRADGTVIAKEGYDPVTRYYYLPAPGFTLPPIDDTPTAEDASYARQFIEDELLGDFRFDTEADKTNYLGLLLTPFVRCLFDGQVPLALIDAPIMGSGKSLLAKLFSIIATGSDAGFLTLPTDRQDVGDEELRKLITSELAKGQNLFIFDNIEVPLKSSVLALALTNPFWTDRLLGRNESKSFAQEATWAATGNNLQVMDTLARRCYRIRIDAKTANPWERENFKHADLIAWARANRGDLVKALIIMIKSWLDADRPPTQIKSLASYESWTQIIGAILAFSGEREFLANKGFVFERLDQEVGEWEGFLAAWHALYGDRQVLVKEVITDSGMDEPLNRKLRESFPDCFDLNLEGKKLHISAGMLLRRMAGRVFGEYRLDKEFLPKIKLSAYRVNKTVVAELRN